MSDDLDSFFSKADKKKKSKGSSKIVAGDLLEQKKEEEARRLKKKEKKKKDEQQMSTIMRKTKEDEDWDDFEDTQEVNFQNLRIANLAEIRDKEPINPEKTTGNDSDNDIQKESDDDASHHSDDSTTNKSKKEKETVWGTKDATVTEVAAIPAVVTTTEDKPVEPTVGAKYVAPCRREGGAPKLLTRKNKTPDISNAMEFPTLGFEPAPEENVEHGSDWTTPSQRNRPLNTAPSQPSAPNPLTHSSNAYVPPARRGQQDSAAPTSASTNNSDTGPSNSNRDTTNRYIPPALRQKLENPGAPSFVSKNKFAGLEQN